MKLRQALWPVARRALADGAVASVLSTVTLAGLTRAAGHSAASGTNATSHWLWGRRAWRRERFDLAHTAAGYAIHHVCSVFWACGFAAWNRARPAAPARVAGRAAGIAVVAAAVDYGAIPRRLTPGFEAHLRPGPIALVYAAFALGLLASHVLSGRRYRGRARRG